MSEKKKSKASKSEPKQHVSQLGQTVEIPHSPESAVLERVPNPHPDTNYIARVTAPEFTSICPKTGLPDFATINIKYKPTKVCIELKSFKMYLLFYRDVGIFHEHLVNKLMDDLVKTCKPRWMAIDVIMNPRGGISTTVSAEYSRSKQ